MTSLPFDGEISRYFREDAPAHVRDAIRSAQKGKVLGVNYPYPKKWKRSAYEDDLAALHIELVKMQSWVRETGQRIVIVFEGRDAAGKGGTIKRFHEHLNPRSAPVVALSKPTETEAGQWYFQRYVQHLLNSAPTGLNRSIRSNRCSRMRASNCSRFGSPWIVPHNYSVLWNARPIRSSNGN